VPGTIQYEVELEGFARVKDMLCQSYIYSISEAFRELVKTYYYAQAAYKIETELRENGENGWSNYWKFEVKNYHFRTVIPRIISLLDYVAVMINELSKRELISNVKGVYFKKLRSVLIHHEKKAGWLSSEEEKDILKDYRDIATHRYLVGGRRVDCSLSKTKVVRARATNARDTAEISL
jgi:hypothetical protein